MSAPIEIKYQSTGIGGAGNYYQRTKAQKALLEEQSASVASSTNTSSFKSGIGGAGNFHKLSSLDLTSFAKDLVRARSVPRSELLAVRSGIGGAGNWKSTSRNGSIASSASSYVDTSSEYTK